MYLVLGGHLVPGGVPGPGGVSGPERGVPGPGGLGGVRDVPGPGGVYLVWGVHLVRRGYLPRYSPREQNDRQV